MTENQDLLKYAIEHGIIELSHIEEQVEMNKRKELLEKHPYRIWEGKDQYWHTYLSGEDGKRIAVKRKHREDVEQIVIDYWEQQFDNPTIKEVFDEWNDRRLELKKIAESTHLRYQFIFQRHFGEFGKRRIKTVEPEEFEEFLEEQIPKYDLKSKAFINLKALVRGMLKRAKKRKLISFNISEIFDDIDVSDKDFAPNLKSIDHEVFNEKEMPMAVEWLMSQRSLLNLGVILLFVTGLRIGELAALKWEDWDGCALRIHRTETRYKGEGKEYIYKIKDYPKTPAGVRSAVIPPHCMWIMDEIKELNPDGEFIFEKNGVRIRTYTFRKRVYRMCKMMNTAKKSPHTIRKTYASILLDNQIPEKNIIEFMGHTDIQVTKDHYAKDRKNNKIKAELLDTIPEFRI